MAASRGALGITAALVVLLAWAVISRPVGAQTPAELQPLGRDGSGQVDRYQVTLGAGATLWDLATTTLPLVALDQSDQQAYQLVLESFQRALPDRRPDALQPGDSFPLEVPAGTFVAEQGDHDGANVVYRSFQGDELTAYPRQAALLYRLVRHDHPDQAEVRLGALAGSAVDVARAIYRVDPPDFVQVRTVRAAQTDRSLHVIVDLKRRYLDDFRNYRERATRTESGGGDMQVYVFAPDDRDNPFLRVEDAVGDQTDPSAFPRHVRLAFYRDGTVREYLITQPGDRLAALDTPETARWRTILPKIADWQPGTVEPLPPFAPAVNQAGALFPDRLLVLRFAPQVEQPPGPSTGGLGCAGFPLALVLAGWGLAARGGRGPLLSIGLLSPLPRRGSVARVGSATE